MEGEYDLIVVGAGPSGLCAAKTFLECDPGVNLLILDSNNSIGGVWAKENLYPGLKTNNLRGTLDFTDMPMHDGFGIREGEHVTGEVMHDYLLAYAQKWDLLRRIRFSTRVAVVERAETEKGWKLTVQGLDQSNDPSRIDQANTVLRAKKLIVATGVTNEPHHPAIPGKDQFDGPVVHSAALGREQAHLFKDDSIKSVAVLGGGKSAYDAVYAAACAGKEVEWIIRKSGKGPVWVFPSHTNIGPFKAWREKLTTRRIVSFFSPCIWGAQDGFGWIRKFLHTTFIGKLIAQKFWANIHQVTVDDCGFAKDERFKMLEPEQSPFWFGTKSGVSNYEKPIFDFVSSGQVRIHRQDISHLSRHSIHFQSDDKIPALAAQALITATGFSPRPAIEFNPPTLHSALGIPTQSLTSTQAATWEALDRNADMKIEAQFPRLVKGPFRSPSSTVVKPYDKSVDPDLQYTSFRLYRTIAPPGLTAEGDRSLAFIGYFSNIANTLRLEISCLWAYAYLSGRLHIDLVDPTAILADTALMARYNMFRTPYGHGRFFPDLVFDQNPFFDLLLADLGLKYWRKGNVFREIFEPYGQQDYRGLVGEWLVKERLA